jgi:hypothetical protein
VSQGRLFKLYVLFATIGLVQKTMKLGFVVT